MSDNLIEKIHSIAEDRFKETDLEHCFIVDVSIKGSRKGSKIEVFIDGDIGVKFQDCQKLSRSIEAYLDESQIVGEKYTLNVSSPGIGRPLKFKRQYPQNVGRDIEVTKTDRKLVTGELLNVLDDKIFVKTLATKKKDAEEHSIKFEEIISSKILISFKK